MKRIIIVRHAKAIDRTEDIGDFERSLTEKGRNDSIKMARRLKKRGILPDLMLSSPANRALETAQVFAEELGYSPQKILLRDSIYESNAAESFLYIFQELNDQIESAAIFGHNPSLSEFADILIDGFEHYIPKTAILEISYETDEWNKIMPGQGTLVDYDYPAKKIRIEEIGEQAENYIVMELERKISEFFNNMDSETAKALKDKIEKAGRKLARNFLKRTKNFKIPSGD